MKPSAIILHHSLTPDGNTVGWQSIRLYHKSWKYNGKIVTPGSGKDLLDDGFPVEKPWLDIGYHFGIELVNGEYEVLAGRMMNESGAHCTQSGMNRKSIGICLIGNFDLGPPSQAQWDLTVRLVRSLMDVIGIRRENVFGHREFAGYKSCPGKCFDLDAFRGEL